MNKGIEREPTTLSAISNRLSQISFKNKLIDADLNYKNRITNKIKKINDSTKRALLPQIYAKAEEINKKLSLLQQNNSFYGSNYIATSLIQPLQTETSLSSGSSSILNDQNTQSMFFESTSSNGNAKSRWLKNYDKTRRRSMIVSKFLDGDTKLRIEQMKTFGNRRMSIQGDQKAKDPNSDEQNEADTNDAHKFSKSENSVYPALKAKNPRFGATLSKDAQFAIMKSLEDTIVREIEKNYPDMKNRVPRTTTAQYIRRKLLDNNATESSLDFSAASQSTNENQFFTTSLNNFKYESDLFSEHINQDPSNSSNTPSPSRITTQTEQLNSDLAKKLVVTQQIESAMEILDNLRVNKKKSIKKEAAKSSANNNRIHFDSNVNYSNSNSYCNSRLFASPPIKTHMKSINKLTNLTTPVPLSRLRQESNKSTLNKIETIDKYSNFQSGWMHLLN
jgi:hypothetical protein